MHRLLREHAKMTSGGGDAEAAGEHSALAQASPVELALTGMLFGLIHVLTGPDHLSALATLSAGSSWRSFALGIRWGCGHSIGLVVMAVVFIALDGKLDFSVLNEVTDILVGVFMVALGIYGIHEGVTKFRANSRQRVMDALKRKQSDSDLAARMKAVKLKDVENGHVQADEDEDEEDAERTETDSLSSDQSPQRLLPKGERSSSFHDVSDNEEEAGASPSRRRRRLDGAILHHHAASLTSEDGEADTTLKQQQPPYTTNMEVLAVEDSPSESVVAMQGLLSSRSTSTVSDADASDALASPSSSSLSAKKAKRGPICCGWTLPSIDLRNAQTQKVRLPFAPMLLQVTYAPRLTRNCSVVTN